MIDFAALFEAYGPWGIVVILVAVILTDQRKNRQYLHKFFIEREKTLATIGKNCHDFSEATEKRSAKREEAVIASNDKLLKYLMKLNGGE